MLSRFSPLEDTSPWNLATMLWEAQATCSPWAGAPVNSSSKDQPSSHRRCQTCNWRTLQRMPVVQVTYNLLAEGPHFVGAQISHSACAISKFLTESVTKWLFYTSKFCYCIVTVFLRSSRIIHVGLGPHGLSPWAYTRNIASHSDLRVSQRHQNEKRGEWQAQRVMWHWSPKGTNHRTHYSHYPVTGKHSFRHLLGPM